MTKSQASLLAVELSRHRYWEVTEVGAARPTTLPGPAEGYWVRLRHRERPTFRYLIAEWPDAEELATALNVWGRHVLDSESDGNLHWYWRGEFTTHREWMGTAWPDGCPYL